MSTDPAYLLTKNNIGFCGGGGPTFYVAPILLLYNFANNGPQKPLLKSYYSPDCPLQKGFGTGF